MARCCGNLGLALLVVKLNSFPGLHLRNELLEKLRRNHEEPQGDVRHVSVRLEGVTRFLKDTVALFKGIAK